MHIRKYVGFVSAAVNVELVEVSHEGVVCSWRRSILRVQIDPLILDGLEFGQVVEVGAPLPRVASEKEHTVLKRQTVGP